jgi:hypothetical protein
MTLRIVPLGTARAVHDGLHIGTVRQLRSPAARRRLNQPATLLHSAQFTFMNACERASCCRRTLLHERLVRREVDPAG